MFEIGINKKTAKSRIF